MTRVLALLLLASVAHADDKVGRAKQLYADGKRYYDVADYQKAIEAWKQAYVLASAPMLLFNIGQAYRLGGDCANALRFYASYEREAPKLSNKDELDEARSRCDPHPTNANPPEPIAAKPVETAVVEAPKPEPAKPEPAKPQLPPPVVVEPARPAVQTRVVDDGATERYVGLGVGAAGVGLAITSIVLASRASSTAHEVEIYRGEWGPAQQDLQAHGHTLATWSWITGIAGVVGLGAGATLFVLGHHTSTITIEPTGVAWSGSF